MPPATYFKATPISLRSHPQLTERWVHERIAEDPSILGLGDLRLKDRERPQPRAGRLDLLLQDDESNRRYEVEVQLGPTDEAHIIRTIEYWDIERRRYPQYDHCAVLVAEDVTSRFLNVIGLFNGQIPLIAIQMRAIETPAGVTLLFTKVLDELSYGLVDEDEAVQDPADRRYWEERSSKGAMEASDAVLALIRSFAPEYQFNYTKRYLGLAVNGQPDNFALLFPKRKGFANLAITIAKSTEVDELLRAAGIEEARYSRRGRYVFPVTTEDVKDQAPTLRSLLKLSHEAWTSG